MDSFLGHPISWWIAILAVLRKVRIDGEDAPERLGDILGYAPPPFWTEQKDQARKRQLEMENT